jgi:hypothetical protein
MSTTGYKFKLGLHIHVLVSHVNSLIWQDKCNNPLLQPYVLASMLVVVGLRDNLQPPFSTILEIFNHYSYPSTGSQQLGPSASTVSDT